MATNTTNFNLKKPAYTDTADIADINGNMDKVDVSLNGLADAIAIVANNNNHAAIAVGQYVYVHGHGSLAEGLYTAKSNIAANATLSTSNLQADGTGGLNALNSNKQSKIKVGSYTGTTSVNGNIQIVPYLSNVAKILSAWTANPDTIVLPFAPSSAVEEGTVGWWFHCMAPMSAHGVVANAQLTIYYTYI